MKTGDEKLNRHVTVLIEFLDEQIHQTAVTLARLDHMRKAVITRSQADLTALLETIRDESVSRSRSEAGLIRLRKELAGCIGCDVKDFNLSRLCGYVTTQQVQEITERQQKLRHLISRLRSEHAASVVLLRECARMNRTLLRHVTGIGGNVTYNDKAGMCPGAGKNIINIRF